MCNVFADVGSSVTCLFNTASHCPSCVWLFSCNCCETVADCGRIFCTCMIFFHYAYVRIFLCHGGRFVVVIGDAWFFCVPC